ncbi:quinone oxidoreductase [Tistrella mobilis]|uniref:quinone oxidoreductase family protein n=1 Tax=Tistrella mobilis TaxID=171437 RepID=UPI003557C8A3
MSAVATARAVRLYAAGGTEGFRVEELSVPAPGPGEILIRQTVAGLNFLDIYHRRGFYPLPALPTVIGAEAAGVVEAVGPDVTGLAPGDRIAWAGAPYGGYATHRLLPAWRALKLPDAVGDDVAAASLLRALTVEMLFTRVRVMQPGETVVVHAAAGGIGRMAIAHGRRLGLRMIGIAGGAEKAALARAAGADLVIDRRVEDPVAAVQAATDGGAHLVIDGIGGDMLARSFGMARRFGMVASLGEAAGRIPPVSVYDLGPARSIALARPSVIGFISDAETYRSAGAAVITRMAEGLIVPTGGRLPLDRIAEAHDRLESGAGTGALLLDTGA